MNAGRNRSPPMPFSLTRFAKRRWANLWTRM